MKNFNIVGVHWKIQILEGVYEKPIYRGNCLKRGFGQFADLRGGGGLPERGGGVFEGGGDTPMHTMER